MNFSEGNFTANFTNFAGKSDLIEVPVTSSSKNVGNWRVLQSDPEIQIQASVRQNSDPEWEVLDANWKIQFWMRDGDVYVSSYFNLQKAILETGLWVGDERLTRGIWHLPPLDMERAVVMADSKLAFSESFDS